MRILAVALLCLVSCVTLAQQPKDANEYLIAVQDRAILAYREILESVTEEERRSLRLLDVKFTAAYAGTLGCRSALNSASLSGKVVVICPYAIDTYAGALAAGTILTSSLVDFSKMDRNNASANYEQLTKQWKIKQAERLAPLIKYYIEMLHERHDGWILRDFTPAYCKPRRVAYAIAHNLDPRKCNALPEAKVSAWADRLPANEEGALLGNMTHIFMRAMIAHELGHLRRPGSASTPEIEREILADQYMLDVLSRSPETFESVFLLWLTHSIWATIGTDFAQYQPVNVGGDIRAKSLGRVLFCGRSAIEPGEFRELMSFLRSVLAATCK